MFFTFGQASHLPNDFFLCMFGGMPWFYLFLTIALEVLAGVIMKKYGGTNTITVFHWHLQARVVLYTTILPLLSLARLILFALVIEKLDLSIAFAIRYGASIAIIAVISFFAFAEPFTWVKLGYLALLLVGLVGLSLNGIKY
jgi:multidrug transporter EmrE-like cation transporter